MNFQSIFISVFLFSIIIVQFGVSLNVQNLNKTLFVYNHPSDCKRNEIYIFDYFSCYPCDIKAFLQPSFDKLTCECINNAKSIANYDSSSNGPVCAGPCQDTKTNKCRNETKAYLPDSFCMLKYINFTDERLSVPKHIRIYPHSSITQNDCKCDLKYNYLYGEYCILKELLKNFLNHNAFWQQGSIYAEVKFIAFFCQSLQNITACNHLANLCVQSFFDIEKNSPCSLFLLGQATDATIYTNVGKELHDLRPFLFYKRGKETTQELDEEIEYSSSSNSDRVNETLGLFATVYSLNGRLTYWGPFKPNHINLCGFNAEGLFRNFEHFQSFHIGCDLSTENVIDLASVYGNRDYFSIFLNHTKNDGIRYMQTIPILIENAFNGNEGTNTAEWQLVKRFQTIGALTAYNSMTPQTPVYENSYKLKLFKSIRILRKFEMHCLVRDNYEISIPLIVLKYHQVNISHNTSLDDMYRFEIIVKFEKEENSRLVYNICLPIFLIIGLGFATFRSYIFKRRQNLECLDILTMARFFLHLISNIGNSFLLAVIVDIFYSIISIAARPNILLMLPYRNIQTFKFFLSAALVLKGFYLAIFYWRIAHIDIFFVDWERPKGNNDTFLHHRNNLETSSQCSSIRTLAEANVSVWRMFFVANEWIKLSGKQSTSTTVQGFLSLALFWITNTLYPSVSSNTNVRLCICASIFSSVYVIQRLCRNLIINQIFGSPLQKFIDVCAMANVSIFTLLDPSFGYYVHGRSPHGFSDTDMSSMILQLQRESQNMCGKRGLLSDSDFQTYIMLPPLNLRAQIDKISPIDRRSENLSQVHFQKERGTIGHNTDGIMDKNTTTSYTRVNRFFCAFIDHGIKDMDYIIKDKTFIENLLNCEFESFLIENKGTFYIDNRMAFSVLFLYGNHNQMFIMELVLLMVLDLLCNSFIMATIAVYAFNRIFQQIFCIWVKKNVAAKTQIDKRFLV